jgi:VanZ family protein
MEAEAANRNFVRYQLPVLLWAIVIFVSSSIPSREFPHLKILQYDKLIHFGIFLVLCALTHRALRYQDRFPRVARFSLVFSVVITVLYGAADETHQLFVPGRMSDVFDLLADTVGALVYAGASWILSRGGHGVGGKR